MRLFTIVPVTFIPVMFAMTGPAAAQNWQEYRYPDYSFGVSFPAEPQIESATYQITDDRAVEARVYAVHRKDAEFKVTVAELANPPPEETAVIDHAIKTLSVGGEVKVNISHRVNRVFGRQLSILQGDGARAAVALFDYNGRFYQIEGKSFPPGPTRQQTPSASCNRSSLLAAVPTARRTIFAPRGELATQLALEAPVPASQLRAPRSRLTARDLNYAAVASKRSPHWSALSIPAICVVHNAPIHRSATSKAAVRGGLPIPTGHSHRR